jgi:hypothetical protein
MAFKLRGFSGFGNSPVKQKNPPNVTYYGDKIRELFRLKEPSHKKVKTHTTDKETIHYTRKGKVKKIVPTKKNDKSPLKVGPRGQGGIYNPKVQLELYKKGITVAGTKNTKEKKKEK